MWRKNCLDWQKLTAIWENGWKLARKSVSLVNIQSFFTNYPVDTRRKLNGHKAFRRRPGRLLNVLYTFNVRPARQAHQRWIDVEATLIVNVHQCCFNFDTWLKMKVETYISTLILGWKWNVHLSTLFQCSTTTFKWRW